MSSSVSNRRGSRSTSAGSRRSRAPRWVAAFVVVTALHWLAAQWFVRHRDIPQPAPPAHVPVQIALLKPQQIERSAAPPAAAHPGAARHATAPEPHRAPPHTLTAIAREPHPAVAAQPATPATPAAPAQPAQPAKPASNEPAQPASAPAGASVPGGAPAAQHHGAGDRPAAQPGPASHGVKFSVPPSGNLSYDTFYNGMRNQPGTIHWSSDGQHYEMVVSVPLPFIGTFSWTSEGRVDAFGLAPDRYTEKRGHRAEEVTTFNRASKQIAFTRTPNTVALPDGAQDRFSMVMQLASLVRGDPDAYKPGVTREFFVADDDSGEIWPVTTIGDESVNTDHGFVTARHFMRLPRRDGDRRRIDVWLAPSLGWLPVRLVQTEPNGTQFELVWRGPLTLPSAGADARDGGNAGTAASGAESTGAGTATPAVPSASAPTTPATPSPAPAATGTPHAPAPAGANAPAVPDTASPGATPAAAQTPATQPAAPAGNAASPTPAAAPAAPPPQPPQPPQSPQQAQSSAPPPPTEKP